MKNKHITRTLLAAGALVTCNAWATDGYFPHGYGMKAKGMGGASIAMTDNAFAGANNPALASFAGNRAEAGVDIFMPKRGASRSGSNFGGMMDGDVESGHKAFLIPEFGYNTPINNQMAVGLTVYGNGGMNTEYAAGATACGNMLCGNTKLGIDLMQLIVAPTLSYKLSEQHAIGVSPLLVYQRFMAQGLQAFEGNPMMVASPGQTTNRGYDSSTGLGLRIGYVGKPNDMLTLGASWSPKTRMKKFDKYSQLFADGGNFDIPENMGLGVALHATPTLTVAVDYTRINYSKVRSVGNPSTNMAQLGTVNGPGFGWSDVDVWKLGVQWQATPAWTLRAGYNRTTNPIQSRDVTFNIIAPGVITQHYTVGGTYALGKDRELTFAYMYAPSNSVSGASPMLGGTETIRMSQRSLGIQYGWKF